MRGQHLQLIPSIKHDKGTECLANRALLQITGEKGLLVRSIEN